MHAVAATLCEICSIGSAQQAQPAAAGSAEHGDRSSVLIRSCPLAAGNAMAQNFQCQAAGRVSGPGTVAQISSNGRRESSNCLLPAPAYEHGRIPHGPLRSLGSVRSQPSITLKGCKLPRSKRPCRVCRAMSKENSGPVFRGGNRDGSPTEEDPLFAERGDGAKCPVPRDQQPINEYKSLSSSNFFAWAQKEPAGFALRLGVLGCGVFAFLGWPVASLSFDPSEVRLMVHDFIRSPECFQKGDRAVGKLLEKDGQ